MSRPVTAAAPACRFRIDFLSLAAARQSCSAVRDGAVPLPPGSAPDSRSSAADRLSLATGLPKLRGRRRYFPSLNKRRPSSSRSRMSINLTDVGNSLLAILISLRNHLWLSPILVVTLIQACGPFCHSPSFHPRATIIPFQGGSDAALCLLQSLPRNEGRLEQTVHFALPDLPGVVCQVD